MTRLWLLTVALLALALAGCGPDCDRYCTKLDECAGTFGVQKPDLAQCLRDCNDVGADKARTIRCVIDTSCNDLRAGRCTPTGGQFPSQ